MLSSRIRRTWSGILIGICKLTTLNNSNLRYLTDVFRLQLLQNAITAAHHQAANLRLANVCVASLLSFENHLRSYGDDRSDSARRVCRPLVGDLSDMKAELPGLLQQAEVDLHVILDVPAERFVLLNVEFKEKLEQEYLMPLFKEVLDHKMPGKDQNTYMKEEIKQRFRNELPGWLSAQWDKVVTEQENEYRQVGAKLVQVENYMVKVDRYFKGTVEAAQHINAQQCKKQLSKNQP